MFFSEKAGGPERGLRWGLIAPLPFIVLIFVTVTVFCAVVPASSVWGSTLSEARSDLRAARARLAEIQSELDELALRYSKAEARLYEIDDAVEKTRADVKRSEQDLGRMENRLAERVVDLYKSRYGGAPPVFLEVLLEGKDFGVVMDRLSLLNRVAAEDEDLRLQVERHLEKTEELEDDLERKRRDQNQKLEELAGARGAMEQRMESRAAEYRRLRNKAARLEDEARKAREAARARARERASSVPEARASIGGFVFPVAGPHSFINDWGFARSGGRLHKGTDIMAPRGTPAVACVSGRVGRVRRNAGLGGTTIWLNGDNGSGYYYAHLDGIASGIRAGVRVSAGRVLGYVGSSGNARGGATHLHFQIHPGGGGAINPYFILRASD